MPVIKADDLHSLVSRILLAAGADKRNADRVADALVSSNLCGVDTHGVLHLPRYVEAIEGGRIVPTAWPEVMNETPTTALVTGKWTFGHVAAKYAMDIAIEKAREQNMATVGVVQANHVGRLGEYAELAAAQGMVSFVWASGYAQEQKMAIPYGGREPVLNTNPLAIGFPAGDEPPMIIDYATTNVAGTKVLVARMRNQQLPPGSVVDKDGNPTTDPSVIQDGGSYVPFGGHKGYAIMMAVEFLGRILTGSDDFLEGERGGPVLRHQGVTLMVFRADAFQPLADFKSRADEMSRRVRAIAPAPGFDEVLMPGDLESRARAMRRRDGIPVLDDVWKPMAELAESLGVKVG